VEPSAAAEDAWVRTIRDNLNLNLPFWQDCTPGYYNNEGVKIGSSALFGEPYGKGYEAFDQLIRQWRAAGRLDGLVLAD
jgi:cyclohexanone monooxygenase